MFAADPKGSEKQDQLGGPAATEIRPQLCEPGPERGVVPHRECERRPQTSLESPRLRRRHITQDHRVYDNWSFLRLMLAYSPK